jgi:hypothetical protein
MLLDGFMLFAAYPLEAEIFQTFVESGRLSSTFRSMPWPFLRTEYVSWTIGDAVHLFACSGVFRKAVLLDCASGRQSRQLFQRASMTC